MDIEKLWEILYRERNTASLQELPERFCEDVKDYIARLETEKRKADETRRGFLEDEMRNARMKIEDIIRRRIGKIIKLASSGMDTPPKGMLDEEREIFQVVKSQVEEGRARIFAYIFGKPALIRNEPQKQEEKHTLTDTEHYDDNDNEDNVNNNEHGNHYEYDIVRVLENIPTFMGTDGRIYKVGKEDVIMLPKTNAEILCNRGVAMRFEAGVYKKEKEGGERRR